MINTFPILSKCAHRKEDGRGSLEVLYESRNMVLKRSFSKKGVFRGMHIQLPPYEQTKLIRVVSGRVIDFVVEPTDGVNKVYWQEIVATNDWIKIDSKYAHGFYALEDTIFEYICDGAYNESAEQSYSIVDFVKSEFEIEQLILSEKDLNSQRLMHEVSFGVCRNKSGSN